VSRFSFLISALLRQTVTLALLAVGGCAIPASASTYTYTQTVDPTTASCGSPGNCFIILTVYSPFTNTVGPTLKAGDVVDINVTFSSPWTVAAATGQSAIFGAVLDENYYTCLGVGTGTCLPETSDLATSTETIVGENAGGPIVTTGNNYAQSGFYVAYANVIGPNPGFTLTGFDATLTLVNSDPSPLAVVAVEIQALNAPEPGPIVLTLMGLGLLFSLRKHVLLGTRRR
jgi:hypothetical protein